MQKKKGSEFAKQMVRALCDEKCGLAFSRPFSKIVCYQVRAMKIYSVVMRGPEMLLLSASF